MGFLKKLVKKVKKTVKRVGKAVGKVFKKIKKSKLLKTIALVGAALVSDGRCGCWSLWRHVCQYSSR
jgi:U3 small nucleolar RNA-associated protein 14